LAEADVCSTRTRAKLWWRTMLLRRRSRPDGAPPPQYFKPLGSICRWRVRTCTL
jgi:hypothetical protein